MMQPASESAFGDKPLALVLSGGGARGAYEAGVLSYLFGEFPRTFGRVPRVDVICGTSVGAINACHLAAHAADPAGGVARLVELWTGLQMERVVRLGPTHLVQLPRVVAGGGDGTGLVDVSPLVELVTREVSWRALARTLRRGHLGALAISATEIASGRTTVFLDAHPGVTLPSFFGPRIRIVAGPIGPAHALASAAIPMVFPPVRIGGRLFCDGGLRLNTPIAPAIRLGARRVLVVGLSREEKAGGLSEFPSPGVPDEAPGAAFLLGKVLDAFLLDHVRTDLELLHRLNDLMADGERAFGPDFAQRMHDVAAARGAVGYRPVEAMTIQPSEDIGAIAHAHVRSRKVSGQVLLRQVFKWLDTGPHADADLASYLLFDGAFARKLIDMGRADAAARRDQLAAFLA